jgi:hypothetical protein
MMTRARTLALGLRGLHEDVVEDELGLVVVDHGEVGVHPLGHVVVQLDL